MGVDRAMLDQLRHLLRPLATRIANTVARGVIQLADDGKKLQLVQLGVLAGETVDDGEHHQPYGFSSVPLGGAEAVVLFPNGDRSHPLVVAVSDRRYRPTGGAGGEVTMYHYKGATVRMLESGDIVVTPAAGKQVKLGGATAADGAIKGTTYTAAEGTFLTALNTFVAALGVFNVALNGYAPLAAVLTAGGVASPQSVFALALGAFETALGAFATAIPPTVSTTVTVK